MLSYPVMLRGVGGCVTADRQYTIEDPELAETQLDSYREQGRA